MKMKIADIRSFTGQAVEEFNCLLIDLVFRGNEKNPIIEVYIDSADKITPDLCAKVSRKITELLDSSEILNNYRLDVSSPGVDRPLKFIQQYPKNVGRNFEIQFLDENEMKQHKMKLSRVEGSDLYFESEKEVLKINFNQIKSAKVLISL